MSKKIEEIELRSEEVQDILEKVPNWMIRRGTALLLFLIFLVLVISWLVKYPDVIENETIITTVIPPQKEIAFISEKLDTIFVKDGQIVRKNKILAVLNNSAETEDVYFLKSLLDTIEIEDRELKFPINKIPILLLGEIETAYAEFENSYTAYELNKELVPFKNEKLAKTISLNEARRQLQNLLSQYSLVKKELTLKRKDVERYSSLKEKGVISQLDYEKKELELIDAERGLNEAGSSISRIREVIAMANKDFKGNEISRTLEESRLLRNTFQSFNLLKKAVSEWENRYVFKSEIDGRVSFFEFWSKNQTVNQGDLVFTIIPTTTNEYVAKVKAAANNSGKIRVGQVVNIKLRNYPDSEFGMLKGKVESISLTPDNRGFYLVNVSLPKKLVTTYDKEIFFRQELSGTAQIITEDLRLLERLIYQLRKRLSNN